MRNLRKEILDFWFIETKPAQWFQINTEFDEIIRTQFESAYDLACQGILDGWKDSPEGALAFILLLDQFPRNMYRDTSKAFATDDKALDTAKFALQKHYDETLSVPKKRFLYMPFQHSENLEDQEQALILFGTIKKDDPLGFEYAKRHHETIERFGRFPGRNAARGLETTAEEAEFLKNPDYNF